MQSRTLSFVFLSASVSVASRRTVSRGSLGRRAAALRPAHAAGPVAVLRHLCMFGMVAIVMWVHGVNMECDNSGPDDGLSSRQSCLEQSRELSRDRTFRFDFGLWTSAYSPSTRQTPVSARATPRQEPWSARAASREPARRAPRFRSAITSRAFRSSAFSQQKRKIAAVSVPNGGHIA